MALTLHGRYLTESLFLMSAAPRVVVACDKFKGSLTADEVLKHIQGGVQSALPDADVVGRLIGDGGDGTVAAAVAAGFTRHDVTVTGPTGEPVDTYIAEQDGIAVVELADACGLVKLPHGLDAMNSSSRGFGEAIIAALELKPRQLVLGIGGSASTDGGAGMLVGLGARLLNEQGHVVEPSGANLARVESVDLRGVPKALATCEVVLASDVDSPLFGELGAAHVFAPQKGATAEQVAELDLNLRHWSRVVSRSCGRDSSLLAGAGGAGGVGFAALSILGASMRPGIEVLLEMIAFHRTLAGADLVITGEGCLDEQSLAGKTPIGVSAAAGTAGVPTVAVCGVNRLPEERTSAAGITGVYALVDEEPDVDVCIREAGRLLEKVVSRAVMERLPAAARS